MSRKTAISPLTAALGAVFTVSLANTGATNAAENPFSMEPLSGGGITLAEAKCGEGKCGGAMGAEGKSGKGKFGMALMDADGDGKVTKEEFMQGHEAMFQKIDMNGDDVIDEAERDEHMKKMMGYMKERMSGADEEGGSQ